jgi:hypothetical protein
MMEICVLGRMLEEVTDLICIMVVSQHLLVRTDDNHKQLLSG